MELQTPLSSPMELPLESVSPTQPLDMELQEEEAMDVQKPIKRVRAKMSSQTSPPEAAARKPKRNREGSISKDDDSVSKIKTRITRSTDARSERHINREGGTKKYRKISIKRKKRNANKPKQRTKKNRKHRRQYKNK